jgi:ketosteroid isomerase-like protein
MPRLPLLLILFVSLNSSAQQTDSSIVSQLNRNWIASYTTRDTATMQQILADDFIMIAPNGNKLSRTDVINNVGLKEISVTATIDSASVRIFGQTALVVAYTHFTIRTKDQTSQGSNCYSDLYIKRKGKWKAVAAHVTVLGMK